MGRRRGQSHAQTWERHSPEWLDGQDAKREVGVPGIDQETQERPAPRIHPGAMSAAWRTEHMGKTTWTALAIA
jgi:hypothetical protein